MCVYLHSKDVVVDRVVQFTGSRGKDFKNIN